MRLTNVSLLERMRNHGYCDTVPILFKKGPGLTAGQQALEVGARYGREEDSSGNHKTTASSPECPVDLTRKKQ